MRVTIHKTLFRGMPEFVEVARGRKTRSTQTTSTMVRFVLQMIEANLIINRRLVVVGVSQANPSNCRNWNVGSVEMLLISFMFDLTFGRLATFDLVRLFGRDVSCGPANHTFLSSFLVN